MTERPNMRTRSKSRSPLRAASRISWSQNATRQLKLIVPGAMVTHYLGTVDKFSAMLEAEGNTWQSKVALLALASGITMIALFLYILFLVYLKDEQPDWRTWRRSGSLSKIIPVLTANIIIGWFLHILVLGRWSGMGYLKGIVGATALYTLVFGLLALIPTPRISKSI